ncbi:response regulator transcription factor [uncultured Megamonas sp.]|uniref:response regulator transcription factor n=1 Tax=uncultured Megamonas sp. TaxID=286140 RepID=UPI00266F76B1|nr:response regulator transcription factor [uncultured Megamonas sp.]
MSRILKILLADDHSILRTGLKLLLSTQNDFKVVAEASNGKEVLDLLAKGLDVDVILLDLSMPVMSGLDCLRELNRLQKISEINVLVLTMYNERQYIKEVMLLGAKGYLRKDTLDTELFKALRTLAEGKRYLAEGDASILLDSLIDVPKKKESLSTREEEVLNYIVRGYSLSDIAQKLCLSVKTISTYKTRIMTKLNCKQNSDLVNYALKNNFLNK